MKKISIILFAFVAAICFNACVEDEDPTFVIQESQSEGPLIVTANSTINLIKDLAEEQAFTLVWEDAGYNINTPITYTIEAGLGGTNFETTLENPVIATTSDRFYNWTIGEINNLAIGLGIEPENEGAIDLRVISSVGTNGGNAIKSNVTSLTVTPYATVIPQKDLFFVGSATAAGWENNNNNPPLVRNPADQNVFKFTGKFLGGGDNAFKFLEILGSWQPQWGLSSGSLTSSDILGSDPDTFSVAADGYYTIDVNIQDLTYTINSFDATGATDYTADGVGIIGDATPGGWDNDTDLTQSTFDPHLWYINGIVLENGEAKFRTNNDWAVNWGSDTAITGYGTDGGSNIPVAAGTYNVWFNDLDKSYVFIIQN
ncbi:SusF/SusE family outer membrane protein [Aquimarina sediminis]|uniref:SusF/SusE family outer membrane protein n=1 Tax=Aquimarina sediminis TaxID=2070536 RepID=UPI000CA087B4|nr:SusE domain-containing protein [Aquimarina sediminis]